MPPQTPHGLYTPKSFYTLAGSSAGVWIFTAVFAQWVHESKLRWLALAMALIVGFSRQKRWRTDELLVAFFNGLLIYSSATGINAISTGTAFLERKDSLSPSKEASLLPFLNEKAWWQPVELVQRNTALQAEGAALEHSLGKSTGGELRTERKLDETKILQLAAGGQREAIAQALDLYNQHVPYKWGGKNLREGFDSSGYVAYVLARIGVIKHPETYWSGKLQSTLSKVQPGDEKAGDVVFYSSGVCMIYLGNHLSIGMLPGGIVTGNPDAQASQFTKLGVGRY